MGSTKKGNLLLAVQGGGGRIKRFRIEIFSVGGCREKVLISLLLSAGMRANFKLSSPGRKLSQEAWKPGNEIARGLKLNLDETLSSPSIQFRRGGLGTTLLSAKHPNQIKVPTRPTSFVYTSTLFYSTHVHLVLFLWGRKHRFERIQLLPKVLRIIASAVFIGSLST